MHLSRIVLLSLVLAGCIGCSKKTPTGLSTDWAQNKTGTVDTLLVKRNGVVVARVDAVSNAYTVTAIGTDGLDDVSSTYYDPPNGSATAPDTVIRMIKGTDGVIGYTRFNSTGEVEKKATLDPNAPVTGAQGQPAATPSVRRIIHK
ncbi:MAG: hypothetical protein ACREKL_15875 [Chthoniobacterales bacterium]